MEKDTDYALLKGEAIDVVGEVMGVKRKRKFLFWKESDDEYKQRIVQTMKGRGYHVS